MNAKPAAPVNPDGEEKACSRCGRAKPLAEFVRSTRTLSGYAASCLDCNRDRVNAYAEANRDSIRQRRRDDYASLSEEDRNSLLEANRERSREWYAENARAHSKNVVERRKRA